jgi:Phytanoyl-CoA dioxygenase (PhyH)
MPEIRTAEQVDFRKSWQQNGTAKVAAFLLPHELGDLRTAVDASYDLLRQHSDDDPPTLNQHLIDHYKRWDGIWVEALLDHLYEARPDLLALFDDVIAAAERRFCALFDQDWRLEPKFTFIRCHRTTRQYLPWHIDADAGGIINATDYCINTWLPLDPVGDVLPSLELIPGSNKTMRTLPTLEGVDTNRTDAWVRSNIGGESWIPHAVPGDAILFDHWTLHRTQRIEQESAVRTSCEFRFVRTS